MSLLQCINLPSGESATVDLRRSSRVILFIPSHCAAKDSETRMRGYLKHQFRAGRARLVHSVKGAVLIVKTLSSGLRATCRETMWNRRTSPQAALLLLSDDLVLDLVVHGLRDDVLLD